MKVSYHWLKEYIPNPPKPNKLADLLTMHAFEVENIQKNNSDYIFDIDVLSNRGHDCLSHLGIAREISAITGLKFKPPTVELKEDKNLEIKDLLTVDVKSKDLCPRYVARIIKNVNIGPSPKWLKQKLQGIGQQSINNIVDITNYIALELGQPVHAFDADKLAGKKKKKIIVRNAKKNEEIITLDNEKCKLSTSTLVIADQKNPLAIAGIKGGKVAEIDHNTKNIILESANFDSRNIYVSSRKLGIVTESSLRFEQGLDPNLASQAMKRLASLVTKLAGGKVAKNSIDIYSQELKPKKVSMTISKMNNLLGIEIPAAKVVKILEGLGFEVKLKSAIEKLIKKAKKLVGKPYKFGADLKHAPREFNCSSLVRHVYRKMGLGLPRDAIEQIETGKKISKKHLEPGDLIFSKGLTVPRKNKKWPQGVGHVGIYSGKGKVIHASQKLMKVQETDLEEFKQWRGACRLLEEEDSLLTVKVPTRRLDIQGPEDLVEEVGRIYGYEKITSQQPISALASVRPANNLKIRSKVKNILEGLGLTEVYNYSFVGEQDLKIIQASSKQYKQLKNPLSLKLKYLRRNLFINLLKNVRNNLKYFKQVRLFELGKVYLKKEKLMLAGIIAEKEGNQQNLFYEIKGVVDGLLNKLGITDQWYDDFKATPEWSNEKIWHPQRSAEIKVGNKEIGYLGEINPEILSQLGIKQSAVGFNINFKRLVDLAREEIIYSLPSKYPAVIRDLAVLITAEDKTVDVLNLINSAGGKLIQDIDLFDIYQGAEIPQGKKNLAFHIIYQSHQRTLTDKEVDKVHKKIIKELNKKAGWRVRD